MIYKTIFLFRTRISAAAAVVAMAVGLATPGETFHQRGAQGIGADFDLGKEEPFALAQGEGGFGGLVYPSHIYG